MAQALENGYTKDRINLLFDECDIPREIIEKHYDYGKEVFSKKVMFEMYNSNKPEYDKTIIDIAEKLLNRDGANAGFYLAEGGYEHKAEKLILSLQSDGFKFEDERLKPFIDENIEDEENILTSELNKLGITGANIHLNQSYENFIAGNWEAANSATRNVIELITREIARKIAVHEGETPSFKGHKAVRSYLREKMLDDNESNILSHLMSWMSTKGSHPGMSDENECRLRRILTIGLCSYYLEKYQSIYT